MEFLNDIGTFTLGILSIVFWTAVVIIVVIEVVDFLFVDPVKKAQSDTTPTIDEDL